MIRIRPLIAALALSATLTACANIGTTEGATAYSALRLATAGYIVNGTATTEQQAARAERVLDAVDTIDAAIDAAENLDAERLNELAQKAIDRAGLAAGDAALARALLMEATALIGAGQLYGLPPNVAERAAVVLGEIARVAAGYAR